MFARPSVATIAPLVIGIGISLLAFQMARNEENGRVRAEFA